LELKPGWERAALVKADILAKGSPEKAIQYLAAFVAEAPTSRGAGVALAQLYVEQKRYAEARAVFQRLLDSDPSDLELQYGVAAIAMQMKDYATAERLFTSLKSAGFRDPGVGPFYLAHIAEDQHHYDTALA